MNRQDLLRQVLLRRGDALIVCNLGRTAQELHALGDHPSHFYMLASMGLACAVGLGLALSVERRVIVIEGDGSLLMNLGVLVPLAQWAPDNLRVVVMDDGAYSSTGGQPTATRRGIDLAAFARAAGLHAKRARGSAQIRRALDDALRGGRGPKCVVAQVTPGGLTLPLVPISPAALVRRLRSISGKP